MIRHSLAAVSRYRPRALTLVLLAAIVAAIWLANSIADYRLRKYRSTARPPPPSELQFNVEEASEADFRGIADQNLSYGWPLLWRQYVVEWTMGTGPYIIAQNYSPARLAGDLAIWLVMLAAPAGACEWLLRRYRPGWRFSLRALFVATGLAAAFCAWFAVVRNRAAVQDPLIASVNTHGGTVWGERWGPKWLDQIGADRYCRRILGMHVKVRDFNQHFKDVNNEEQLRLLSDLHRLPDLQYLSLEVAELTPEIIGSLSNARRIETLELEIGELTPNEGEALAEALGGMQHLRKLSVSGWEAFNDAAPDDACLAAIGSLAQLEHLCLRDSMVLSQNLALLSGLTNLKSLTLDDVHIWPDLPESAPTLVASLPPLRHLEALDLRNSEFVDGDLRYIARLPRLKSLNLTYTEFRGAALADLAQLESLEELAIDYSLSSSAGLLNALVELKRLKKLHIEFFDPEAWQSANALRDEFDLSLEEAEACLRAYAALRKANPRLVIDNEAISLFKDLSAPRGEPIPPYPPAEFYRQMVKAWKDKQAGKAKIQGAANSTPAK